MTDALRRLVLTILRVPARPEPPPGDGASIRVFRASPAYFRLRLAAWVLAQIGTAIGLVVGLFFIARIDALQQGWLGVALSVGEGLTWFLYLAQLPLGFAALRLDYDYRWYMLSDRALRIREGVLTVREKTMTFANIQQIGIRQGPVQRALGLADIEVRTAGGGSSGEGEGAHDLHRGLLKGVTDAERIRDTIRRRVDAARDVHPPDPLADRSADAPTDPDTPAGPDRAGTGAHDAARHLLDEIRALRAVAVPPAP